MVTSTAEELFEALVPWNQVDEVNDWHLLKFCEAITADLHAINTIVRDTEERSGWSLVMDADNTPIEYLPWLAQFAGVRVNAELSEADQRRQVKEVEGFKRGTVASLIAAAQPYLTGTKSVIVNERDTSAYHFTVRTFTAETPDGSKVLAALQAQKPAGLVMDYEIADGLTWDEIAASGKTYNELTADFPTSDALKFAQSI